MEPVPVAAVGEDARLAGRPPFGLCPFPTPRRLRLPRWGGFVARKAGPGGLLLFYPVHVDLITGGTKVRMLDIVTVKERGGDQLLAESRGRCGSGGRSPWSGTWGCHSRPRPARRWLGYLRARSAALGYHGHGGTNHLRGGRGDPETDDGPLQVLIATAVSASICTTPPHHIRPVIGEPAAPPSSADGTLVPKKPRPDRAGPRTPSPRLKRRSWAP